MSSERHRLIILADMGNEPDEEQQMVHMIMCSNEFDLDALISVTGTTYLLSGITWGTDRSVRSCRFCLPNTL